MLSHKYFVFLQKIMKKAAKYGLLVLLLAIAGGSLALLYKGPEPLTDADLSHIDSAARLSPSALTDSLRITSQRLLKEETDYYMLRHNVEDEGYEMVAAFANGQRLKETTDTIPIFNIGRWKGKKREGTAVSRDSLGRIIIGNWNADTLTSGVRLDSAGFYQGAFCGGRPGHIVNAKAEGHGSYTDTEGHYFEGHWTDDRREGFGLQMLQNEVLTSLKVGEWQKDQYKGERMNYTSERIYGIDISRYQHGKGRKKYPILWDRLRISHLGSKSKKKISGTVDYPVQFCFIKSTEGTSIRNKYFLKDYQGAKKHGIHTGAYHFYSCKSSGSAQAAYFINSTIFRQGDLPPVLDIEPSDRDIARYGGTDALFRNIRAWLQAVEQRTKVKPILYVNQRFVNKYLPDAPDIKRDYKVWIARYGEYKPDVKLVIWQLSPDGRVQGITGEVDINVFNGYQQQFDEFIANETIK